ncbi:MAG: acyl carrier protein, partial [Myxococcota bacterium]
LSDLGFDSLMATELKAALLADGLDVPLGRVLGGPSLEELANMVAARLPAGASAAPVVAAPTGGGDAGITLVWVLLAGIIVGVGLASGVFVSLGAL